MVQGLRGLVGTRPDAMAKNEQAIVSVEENRMQETIRFTKKAARTIRDESFLCDVETGGTLFGYARGRVVEAATGPGPTATKQACLFSADVEYQREAAARIANQSNGRSKLIGYWHRHPTSPPLKVNRSYIGQGWNFASLPSADPRMHVARYRLGSEWRIP